jgi:hypothetical protein
VRISSIIHIDRFLQLFRPIKLQAQQNGAGKLPSISEARLRVAKKSSTIFSSPRIQLKCLKNYILLSRSIQEGLLGGCYWRGVQRGAAAAAAGGAGGGG